MKETGIIMSGPNIQPILADLKTQTRRIVRSQPKVSENGFLMGEWLKKPFGGLILPKLSDLTMYCPYGQPGDRLWVRESWDFLPDIDSESVSNCGIVYWADGAVESRFAPSSFNPMIYGHERHRPSIHMPRWASRILLEITAVRVERLQDISEEDARAEGVLLSERSIYPDSDWPEFPDSYKHGYEHLWESINGAGSWDKNPFVWVIEFKRTDHAK